MLLREGGVDQLSARDANGQLLIGRYLTSNTFDDRIVAVLVIYVDDGFLVTFDKEVAKKTEDLLRREWQVRDWDRCWTL